MVPGEGDGSLWQHVNNPLVLRNDGGAWQLNNGFSQGHGSHAQVRSLNEVLLSVLYIQMGSKSHWNVVIVLNAYHLYQQAGEVCLGEIPETLMTHEIHNLILDSY